MPSAETAMTVSANAGERRRLRADQARSRRRMSQWAGTALEDGVGDRLEPECDYGEGVGRLSATQGEESAEILGVLGAEAGGIQVEEGAVEAHQALPGVKPRERAMRTSWAMRRDSASATMRPNGVMR